MEVNLPKKYLAYLSFAVPVLSVYLAAFQWLHIYEFLPGYIMPIWAVLFAIFVLTCLTVPLLLKLRRTTIARAMSPQSLSEIAFWSVLLIHISSCVLIAFFPRGIGESFASWILDSLSDAAILDVNAQEKAAFFLGTKVVLALSLIAGFMPWISSFACFTASYIRHLYRGSDLRRFYRTFVETLSVKVTALPVMPAHPWLENAARTFWFILACYVGLFSLIAFCPGGLGQAISGWLEASMLDAGLPEHLNFNDFPQLRWFLASVVAMYGCVPFAIGISTALFTRKPPQLALTEEGMLLPGGLEARSWFRPLRFWEDVKSVSLSDNKVPANRLLTIKFKSGGCYSLRLRQIADADLEKLLSSIDEYSSDCQFNDAALHLRTALCRQLTGTKHVTNRATLRYGNSKFKSTVFAPLLSGQFLKDRSIRIVKSLTSKPLAAVYLVRLKTGQLAVLKQFVIPESEENLRLKAVFERECELLKSLDHPAIVKVLDVFDEGGANYLLLEHVTGQDLQTALCDGKPPSESVVLDWAIQIAEVMNFLHDRQPPIVHRDLTPDNIIIDDHNRIKLIDFGAAHQFLEGVTGTLVGKQCYVPPEQLRGKATVRSDVYAFGATLYFLLTGRQPVALKQCDFSDCDVVLSERIKKVIAACTEFDEADRPSSFKEVLAALRNEAPIEACVSEPVSQTEPATLLLRLGETVADSEIISLNTNILEPESR